MTTYRFGQDVIVRNYYGVTADSLEQAKAKLKADPERYWTDRHPDEDEIDGNVKELMNSDYMVEPTLIEEAPDD